MAMGSTRTNMLVRLVSPALVLGLLLLVFPAGAGAATACANEARRAEQHAGYLPDCRGFELVTPAQKDEEEAAPPNWFVLEEVKYQPAVGRPATSFSLSGAFPESEAAAIFAFGLSQGSEAGKAWDSSAPWLTNSLEPVRDDGGPKTVGGPVRLSPELTCGYESTRLAPPAHPGESTPLLPTDETPSEYIPNLYQWSASGDSLQLMTELRGSNPTLAEDTEWNVDGMSEDCSRVAFNIGARDGGEIPLNEGRTEFAPANSIYEWAEAAKPHEKLATYVPVNGGTEEVPGTLLKLPDDGNVTSSYNAMSTSGNDFYFDALSEEPGVEGEIEGTPHSELGALTVFNRYDSDRTFDISRSDTKVPDTGAEYEAASQNGERVFFLANYGIASNGTSNGTPGACTLKASSHKASLGCDLYEYRASAATPGEGTLTDLSVDGQTGGADVTAVAGISNDGEYVYFDAIGQLVEGEGPTEAENAADHTASLYVEHAGHVSYIATIEATEGAFPGSVQQEEVMDAVEAQDEKGEEFLAARVSPNGKRFMFATRAKQKVVGLPEPEYNNLDSVSGKPDPELYEYEYTTGSPSITCVSCQPEGKRPTTGASLRSAEFGEEGVLEPVLDAVPSTELLNDGRVFFNSYTPLVSTATNSVHPYEFEPDGYVSKNGETCEKESGCVFLLEPGTITDYPSWVIGASEEGENAYILTYERLAPQDEDDLRDLYDVREGGGEEAAAKETKCSVEEGTCQGEGTKGIETPTVESGGPGENTKGSTKSGPSPESIAPIKVTRKRSTSRGLTVTFKVFGSGLVRLSGAGLTTDARIVGRAGTYTAKTSFSRSTLAALRKHRHPRIKVTLLFRPLADTGSDSHVTWTLKA